MRSTIENTSSHASLGARGVAKCNRVKQGYNHFREWEDHRQAKPYMLAYKRVRGDHITTIQGR